MNFDHALRRYLKDEFNDRDITRCAGLRVRAWRELIKIGAVRTATDDRGPGRIRTYDTETFKRSAIIAALNNAGFSLAVSGRMACFLPLDILLYSIWDPRVILFSGSNVNPATGLPPRLKHPKADWFDPDKPARADPENDWLLEIYENRFVAITFRLGRKDKRFIYGELRNEGTSFVSRYPFHKEMGGVAEEISQMRRYSLHPDYLDYQYEDHVPSDPIVIEAEDTARSPVFKTTVNLTLALRKALRRYLGIEPAPTKSNVGDPSD